MPDLTPAQELRAGAERLRTRAAAITPSDPNLDRPWHVEECASSETGSCPCIVAYQQYDDGSGFGVTTRYVADAETPELARWIALMHPGVGLALADWLEREARHHDATVTAAVQVFGGDETARDAWIAEQTNGEALAVARAILGRVTQ